MLPPAVKTSGGEVQVGPAKVNANIGLGPDRPHTSFGIGIGDRQIGFDLNPGAFIKSKHIVHFIFSILIAFCTQRIFLDG